MLFWLDPSTNCVTQTSTLAHIMFPRSTGHMAVATCHAHRVTMIVSAFNFDSQVGIFALMREDFIMPLIVRESS